jgi:uncharacterized repeat protein (TIGR03847 family)
VSDSFDFRDPDGFTAAALGPPGQRIFYLRATEGPAVATLKIEKQQVAALAEYLERVLADLPPVEPDTSADLSFNEPVSEAWVVGPLGVAYDEEDDRVVLVAEELVIEDEPSTTAEPRSARFHLDRRQVAAFVNRARELVESGRATCLICGLPMDPAGHACPRNN